MNELTAFLLAVLLWWVVLFGTYALVLFSIDALITGWGRYRLAQRRRAALAAELGRIDRQAAQAVQRIGVVLAVAQQLVRDAAAAESAGRSCGHHTHPEADGVVS